MSAFGGKADMTFCGNSLSRSLLGAKRTCPFALHMSAYDPKRTLTRYVARWCVSGTLRANRINCVRFDAVNFVFCKPTHIVGLYARCRFGAHFLDCPAQPRPEGDGPPVISRTQWLNTLFRYDLSVYNAAVLE